MGQTAESVSSQPSARARAGLLVATVTLLIGAALVAVLAVEDRGVGRGSYFAALLGLQVANNVAGVWLMKRFRVPSWQLDAALLAAGIVLLPNTGVVLTQAVGAGIGTVLTRRPAQAVVITTGQACIATFASVVFASAVGGDDVGAVRFAVVVLLATAVWATLCELVATTYFAVVAGEPFSSTIAALRFSLPRTPFIGALGYMAGLAGTVAPLAGLFIVPPLGAMLYVLAEHLRAKQDRSRAETLFHAAEAAHASIEPEDVVEAITAAAADMLHADRAVLRPEPPGEGEIGVQLDTTEEQWLVVAAEHDEDAVSLLSTVAAVGTSALENARLAEQLRHQAVHDGLTGLPNRVLFADRVAQATRVDGRERRFVVMVLDLDAFRKVNDSLGHGAGDELLREVAERLVANVRPGDTVARLSSDVFVVLLPGVDTAELAGVMTEKLLSAVRRPIELGSQEVFMTACAGLAFFPDDGQESSHLLRNADSALHRAKAAGPGSYEIYAQGMNELAHQRLARESELHQAVRRDELRVRYQPQIDLRTGRLIGVEALVRWDHPTLGMLAPNEFVPLAEESGLIVEVDTWVLRKACAQAATWLAEGLPPVRVAVNLSARHFQSPERLIGTIRDVVVDCGLHPSLLELEVTEGLAVVEDRSAEILQRVRDLGVSISIDDFGTGYSMLGRLHRFPVDRLKIDRSFVREIVSARTEAPIVSAIIAMARSLGIETVAEGIETLEQQTYLRNRACDLGQGFLFSHPTEPDEIVRMLVAPSLGLNLPPALDPFVA